MTSKNIPKNFWPEAAKKAAYVINKIPTLYVKNMTSKQAWSGVNHSVHHFKVFGCIAYVHISDVHRKRLGVNSAKCLCLGVGEK